MMDLHCGKKLHGRVVEGLVEVTCDSRFCGKEPGVVVVHRFDLRTGELVETRRFKQPPRPPKTKEEKAV